MAMISYLTRIHFADDILQEAVKAECEAFSVRRPLVVTDPGLVKLGLVERLLDALAAVKVTLYDQTPANPDEASVREAVALFQSEGCDSIFAMGGGSSLDLAKAVALLATHDGPLTQYAAIEGGVARIQNTLPPLIAIPTTAGTGSEVGRGALIVFDDGVKRGILSPHLIPKAAICDPVLTLDLPARLTAGTGMDALTHCVETYISAAYNPPADGIALDGLRRAATNIERAVNDGHDIAARREMMASALNGALAFQKGLGGVHAISHALGGGKGRNLHHGTLNAILLPHILTFNAPAAEHKYPDLLAAMGLPAGKDVSDAMFQLSQKIGLPTTLSALGVDRDVTNDAAPLAEADHTNGTNPRRATASDYAAIMAAAL
ncbi:MAG: iron-containing alcohol dehydrogenase [Pseudomonadota bacterium]